MLDGHVIVRDIEFDILMTDYGLVKEEVIDPFGFGGGGGGGGGELIPGNAAAAPERCVGRHGHGLLHDQLI